MAKGKILVIRGGAIGDFILTLPVLSALRAQFPETRLEVLGYPHIARLALEGGLADDVRSIEARPLAGFFAEHADLDFDLSQYFAGFAVIVSYLYDPQEIFKDNIARISRAQFIQALHRPDEAAALHATRCFLQPLERLTIFDADPVPRLTFAPPAEGHNASPRPWLALHPGSGSEAKNWPEDRWAGLIREVCARTDASLLLVGGEAEGARLARLAALIPGDRRRLAAHLPLPELARELRACTAFVGHDSGISHLAAAVGLPGVVLWANTREEIWRPPSEKVRIIRDAAGIQALSVEKVFAEVTALLMG
jgi:heptosyltransferase III